jgi:hypothetical protein
MGGDVERMGMRNTQEISVGKPKGKNHLENLGVDGTIIFQWVLKNLGIQVWIVFNSKLMV